MALLETGSGTVANAVRAPLSYLSNSNTNRVRALARPTSLNLAYLFTMLCNACRSLTIDSLHRAARDHPPGSRTGWNQAGYLILQPSFSALVSNAKTGCENCSLYMGHFFKSLPDVFEKAASLGEEAPVIAFLSFAKWDDGRGWQQYITQLHLQIGTEPWRAGDKSRLCVAFRVSQPRSKSPQNHALAY